MDLERSKLGGHGSVGTAAGAPFMGSRAPSFAPGAAAMNQSQPKYAPSQTVGGDRKSTRLNSSHSQISYAVFCLKKKKNTKLLTLRFMASRAVRQFNHAPPRPTLSNSAVLLLVCHGRSDFKDTTTHPLIL